MRNLLLLSIAFLATVVVNAQEFDKEAITKLSNGVCECIEGKEGLDTREKAELEFGRCIMQVYSNDQEYFNEKGLDITNPQKSLNIGKQVGVTLASTCEEALPIFMMIARDVRQAQVSSEEEEYDEQEYIEFTGKIVKSDDKKFTTFEIKDEDGRRHKVLWLTYVDNDELLEDAVKGKKSYVFTAMELDIYDPRIGEYRNMLVLDRIDTIEE
ncbi:hypothetical protein [Nonlabens sp. Asnod2-A12]|uniref:hypothetical protein n=1 Tax=Nonlabens sp. Asnod2-A12 TaxID=3160578 RepID=UPI00386884BB